MSERDYRRGPLKGFRPYVAGKPPKEVQRELGIPGPIAKLASNENPLGPSPVAIQAVRDVLESQHFYPFDDSYYFKEAVARFHNVRISEVFAAAGSVEVIELVGPCLLEPGDEVVTSDRTFAIYYLVPRKAGADLVIAPCKDGYFYDLEAILARVTPRTKVVFLANPTNPTGTWFGKEEFDRFMERLPEDILVVYDEAYVQYVTTADYPDADAWFRKGRDILILRTFSKAYGLAGMRVGYAYGPERIVSALNLGRFPFNVSFVSQVAGIAALQDVEHVTRSREYNRVELEWMRQALRGLDIVIPPSQTNFLLIDTSRDGEWLFVELQKRGVVVRPMAGYGMPGAVRVSPGTREENERFVRAFRDLVG